MHVDVAAGQRPRAFGRQPRQARDQRFHAARSAFDLLAVGQRVVDAAGSQRALQQAVEAGDRTQWRLQVVRDGHRLLAHLGHGRFAALGRLAHQLQVGHQRVVAAAQRLVALPFLGDVAQQHEHVRTPLHPQRLGRNQAAAFDAVGPA